VGPSRNAPCPCGSGRKAKACCGPALDGRPAPTAEALMRSRYTAYAVGAVAHVMATTAPESPHRGADPAAWRDELRAYCAAVTFEGLQVREAREEGDRATVTFSARLRAGDRDLSFGERSRFVRRDGRWLYVDGDRLPA
jgi:SEC-C motif-containing protein